jgi:hypothetical protein
MLIYIALVFVAGFIVYLIVKKGFLQFLTYFFAGIMGLSWFSIGMFYGFVSLFHIVNFLNSVWDNIPELLQRAISFIFETRVLGGFLLYEISFYIVIILLAILGTVSFGIQSFKRIWIRNTMMIFFGPMIGSFLAIHFGLLSVFLILIGLSLYDVYAVFRGPLKGIIDESRESAKEVADQLANQELEMSEVELVPLMPSLPVYSTPLINIGLGDFAFFSMFVSVALVISIELLTPLPVLLSTLGLLGGAYITFNFLQEDRALPGLPLPIFSGIGLLVLSLIITLIIGGTTIEAIIGLFY